MSQEQDGKTYLALTVIALVIILAIAIVMIIMVKRLAMEDSDLDDDYRLPESLSHSQISSARLVSGHY